MGEFEFILKRTKALIGHEMIACGVGIRDGCRMKAVSSLNSGFPEDFFAALVNVSGHAVSPLFTRWLESQTPQVLQVNDKYCLFSADKKQFYRRFSIKNVMSHGVLDCGQGYTSYFGFANIAEGIEAHHINLMQIIIPHLHRAYMQTANVKQSLLATFSDLHLPIKNEESGNGKTLSAREIEVSKWLFIGRTNDEIGKALNISGQTVKAHVQKIIKKLKANNRQNAVAKALHLGIIEMQ